jgi:hypothetical protein
MWPSLKEVAESGATCVQERAQGPLPVAEELRRICCHRDCEEQRALLPR